MILADTGVLYGATDRDDPRHADCVRVLDGHTGELLVPVPVVVESAWLIESRLGPAAEAGFLQALNTGELERVDLTDLELRTATLLLVRPGTRAPKAGQAEGADHPHMVLQPPAGVQRLPC